ncbi:sigma-54-dependent Fis family transcriptional regulator [Halobacillus naozhouensis]|uniref:Sigma 54-interacting transcriptional regulator n=1 Tax=Halobacillus naozhouensis TaxID=554880 RepID=A0ABY8IZJ3_9BACI|nr:sigma-54-dependent Fis family transcriptional regulator [Halobacillus naozhouensis]WFT74046.1 sigma 54-interacting transcriptional regulator [Halobacillus naozhouensis]
MTQEFIRSSERTVQKEEMFKIKRWMVQNHSYIEIDQTIREAAHLLDHLDVDYIPVLSEGMKPVGVVTEKAMLTSLLRGEGEKSVITTISKKNFAIVRSDDSLLDMYTLPFNYFTVVDDQNRLVGMVSGTEILKGLSWHAKEIHQSEHSAETLNVILESAYEGVVVVDGGGVIREFNEAYSRFTGIDQKGAIGRHVQQVIDNTNLHNTVKTGIPERGAVQYIQGQAMIVHRIPIWKNDRVVGAIGMLIFEGVTELYRIYERFQENMIQHTAEQTTLPTRGKQNNKVTLDQIIGVSPSTSNTKRMARKVAKTTVTVLITGESGTGKEMYAKGIHHLSPFSEGPFISVNCGGIPEHLFESELFGYEEGAFTGARKGGKPGKFDLAQNGTLFLDEIGEMPLMMQTKLLRVLQDKEFEPVGGLRKVQMDTRIITATNRNLEKMVEAGEFREDLFYRLNVIELPVAPLRQRTEDIPQMISHYLYVICNKYQVAVKTMTSEAVAACLHYGWPGNIRELVNTIEKLVVMVDGDTIDRFDLPASVINKEGNEQSNGKMMIISDVKTLEHEKEKELIQRVLKDTKGNKSKAADELGIHRTTLYQKIKKYRLSD